MEDGVRRGYADSLGCAAGLRRCSGRRWVGAEAGGRPGDHPLSGLEEEIRIVLSFWVRRNRRGPPVLRGAVLELRCGRRLTSGGVVRMMPGPGGLAALFLEPARPVPRFLLSVPFILEARLPVRVALLPPVVSSTSRHLCVSRLAERSPRTLAVLGPGSILSPGGVVLDALLAPVILRTRFTVVPPRGFQQGSSGLAFGERRTHRALPLAE